MKPRISYYVQLVAFTLALATPLAVIVFGSRAEIFYCTGYFWGVGMLAALWHRGTVTE